MSPDKIGLGSPGFFCSVPPKPSASLASKSLLESRCVKARVTLDLDLGSSWPPRPGDGGLDLRKERPSCVASGLLLRGLWAGFVSDHGFEVL